MTCFILVIHLGTLNAQTLVYDTFLENRKVGQLTVVKEEVDNVTRIHSVTEIKANIPFLVTVELDVKSSYLNGVLVESKAVSTHNGKVYSTVNIIQSANGYTLEKDGDITELPDQKLKGADCFYFEEPTTSIQVVALASGEYYQVNTATSPGEYVFVRDKRDENRYYLNGVLQEVDINHKLYTVVLKLVQ
jgi:hypothetical protein